MDKNQKAEFLVNLFFMDKMGGGKTGTMQ